MPFKDITNKRFGQLTAISLAEPERKKSGNVIWWNCLCKCGNEVKARGWELRCGNKKHCGCVKKPVNTHYRSKIRVSRQDEHLLKKHQWFIHKSSGYLMAKIDGKSISFHRYIFGCPKNVEIDHVNRKKLDNRRSNLRFAPRCINNLNKDLLPSNKTGYTGVFKIKATGRYSVGICKPRIYLGAYKNIKDAAYVYRCMKNFIMSDYQRR